MLGDLYSIRYNGPYNGIEIDSTTLIAIGYSNVTFSFLEKQNSKQTREENDTEDIRK